MATVGPSLFSLIPVVMMLVGIVSILRARRSRRRGDPRQDSTDEKRQVAIAETERRMAAYLASRDRTG